MKKFFLTIFLLLSFFLTNAKSDNYLRVQTDAIDFYGGKYGSGTGHGENNIFWVAFFSHYKPNQMYTYKTRGSKGGDAFRWRKTIYKSAVDYCKKRGKFVFHNKNDFVMRNALGLDKNEFYFRYVCAANKEDALNILSQTIAEEKRLKVKDLYSKFSPKNKIYLKRLYKTRIKYAKSKKISNTWLSNYTDPIQIAKKENKPKTVAKKPETSKGYYNFEQCYSAYNEATRRDVVDINVSLPENYFIIKSHKKTLELKIEDKNGAEITSTKYVDPLTIYKFDLKDGMLTETRKTSGAKEIKLCDKLNGKLTSNGKKRLRAGIKPLPPAEETKKPEIVKKPKPKMPDNKNSRSSDVDASLITIGSGSGFYINNRGYALTNNHVIDICKQSIAVIDGKETLFRVIATDKTNDVAVLKTDYKSRNFIKINEDGAKLGENVIAVGYPLAGRLSDSVKITRGIVSSLSGLDNNIGQIQIDAALQPGNSGGPVLNENGELVGIASAGLNKLLMAKEAKYIPENVNFAVASPIVVNILKSKKVKYTAPGMFGGSFSNTELAELGDSSTIQLFCRNTRAEYARLKKSKQYSQVLLDID